VDWIGVGCVLVVPPKDYCNEGISSGFEGDVNDQKSLHEIMTHYYCERFNKKALIL
jgi:hypothetical protein